MKNNNITRLTNCYGCGVCTAACPQKIINLKENRDGFYIPTIKDTDACTNCGICLKVCSFNNPIEFENRINAYASWSSDSRIRHEASSGGIAYELAKEALQQNYKVCAVIYDNENGRAIHTIITEESELVKTLGSKYIPSFTESAFKKLNIKPNGQDKYIVFGTPCQIASLRFLLQKYRCENRYILVDFFCHGVPSLRVWDKYIHEKKLHSPNIKSIRWRDKKYGWHDSWYIVADAQNSTEIYRSMNVNNDEFFNFFLGHLALNECCLSSCKFKKQNSLADIRLGDLWGNKYKDNSEGISGIICFTKNGHDFVCGNKKLILVEESTDVVTEGQMKKNAIRPKGHFIAKILLRNTRLSLAEIKKITERYEFLLSIPAICYNKIKSLISL